MTWKLFLRKICWRKKLVRELLHAIRHKQLAAFMVLKCYFIHEDKSNLYVMYQRDESASHSNRSWDEGKLPRIKINKNYNYLGGEGVEIGSKSELRYSFSLDKYSILDEAFEVKVNQLTFFRACLYMWQKAGHFCSLTASHCTRAGFFFPFKWVCYHAN